MTSPFSPYQPPRADSDSFEPEPEGAEGSRSATRAQRFWAALIDALISIAIMGPIQYRFGVFDHFPNIQKQTALASATWGAVGFAAYCLVHGYFLIQSSQTVGKRLLGIRIENMADGRRAKASQILLARSLPIAVLAQIPLVGPWFCILDVVFIFRRDNRCLHDYVAGTVVTKTR